jgi:DNA polymerase III epsilon subunit-like protein
MSVSEVVANLNRNVGMRDVMLDLETLGLYPGAVIMSLGAVVFDLESSTIGEKFYVNIDRRSCTEVGMRVDPATEGWWAQQSAEAKAALLMPAPVALYYALDRFVDWIKKVAGADVRVWSHGAAFDIPLLRDAERRIGLKMPWSYKNERDTRTLFMAAEKGNDKSVIDGIWRMSTGTAHNALDDAINQAKQMCELWRLIR